MRKSSFIALVAGVLAQAACSQEQEAPVLNKADFQMEFTGKQTDLYKLTNSKGAEVWVTNFGARIVAIMVPDKNGNKQDAAKKLLMDDKIDPMCPATFMRLHRDAIVVIEKKLADEIGYKG